MNNVADIAAPRDCTRIRTLTGLEFDVRATHAGDEAALQHFFAHVTPEDLRHRFLSAVKHVGLPQIEALTHGDHVHKESFIALDAKSHEIAGLVTVASNDAADTGEVAICIHGDYKAKGLGWSLLLFAARFAQTLGIRKLTSIESRTNFGAIALERELGFHVAPLEGDPTLVMVTADVDELVRAHPC